VAALIRYASRLQREGRDLVPLEEELEFARRYLALEELRLEDRLQIRWEVEDGLGGVPVPAFCLQTLLENAVKHGLSPRPSGGTIRIGATRQGESVVLSVEDDGEGATAEDVKRGNGQGLRLLEDRIRLMYGPNGSLEWSAESERGFTAVIRVPGEVTRETGATAEGGEPEGEAR
jgi:LytS/YehU family sensor histidine kinase